MYCTYRISHLLTTHEPPTEITQSSPNSPLPPQAFELFYNAPFNQSLRPKDTANPTNPISLPEFTKKLECKVPQLFAEACPEPHCQILMINTLTDE